MFVSTSDIAPDASLDSQAARHLHGLRRVAAGGLMQIARMIREARAQRRLAHADDMMLADLGICRSQATFEASRRFWDWGGSPEN